MKEYDGCTKKEICLSSCSYLHLTLNKKYCGSKTLVDVGERDWRCAPWGGDCYGHNMIQLNEEGCFKPEHWAFWVSIVYMDYELSPEL